MNFVDYFSANQDRIVKDWIEFLKIPSISTDPKYNADCVRCAEWLAAKLSSMGLKSKLLETSSKPVVYARYECSPSAKTVLFYGHYDVQPVDPLNLWDSPPFEPRVADGRIFARGAEDNKGQSWYAISAVEALIKAKELKVNLTMIFEGEEECGSEGLTKAVGDWAELIKADYLMVCDTGMVPSNEATITMGLRGLVGMNVLLYGPHVDTHSGSEGGACPNPAIAAARLVATLHDTEGRIAVKGYYDEVREVSVADRKLANEVEQSVADYEKSVGAPPVWGEPGFTVPERTGLRPTIEINGLHSGYGGAGGKTIIPAMAEIKITSRLVGGQKPERCLKLLEEHLTANKPKGIRMEFKDRSLGGPALLVSSASPAVVMAKDALLKAGEKVVRYSWEGGSIPVLVKLAEVSGAAPVLVGFSSLEGRAHSPNENFPVASFKRGFMYAANFLASLK
jgi:acetylornithine deacetylase/succinyl-diaminopimelate desuccinylase-like protein